MSIRASVWAWTVTTTPTAKLVLMALADHADETGLCWPSMSRLADRTCLSERAARNAIRTLEDVGLITTEARDGAPSRYRLSIGNMPEPRHEMPGSEGEHHVSTPAPDAGVSVATPARDAGEGGTTCRGGRHEVPGGAARRAPEPSRTIIEPSVNQKRAARGSRLPPDWQPSNSEAEYATERGLDPAKVAEDFRDYWTAKAGAKGVMLDWAATWRRWCRTQKQWADERKPRQRPQQFRNPATAILHAEMFADEPMAFDLLQPKRIAR